MTRDAFDMKAYLRELASELIDELCSRPELDIREGVVLATGDPPYRRLDCDKRAIAYVRVRPKKRLVRVDVTGLWQTPRSSRIRIPNAGGSATLVIKSPADRAEAVRFIARTVARTRRAAQRAGHQVVA